MGTFHTSQPVAEFLFEKKKGYCQYFASAAAVLLRLEGVPTRYVSGFHVTENNRVGNHYLVREMDAHAWVESYIPGKGWVQVDPTPGAEYNSLHAALSQGWLARALEWSSAGTAEFLLRFRTGGWRAELRRLGAQPRGLLHGQLFTWTGAVVLAAALLGGLVRPWLRRRPVRHDRTESSEPQENLEGAPALAQLLRRLDAYWIRFDCARPRHRALLEHLETVSPENVSPEMHEGIRRLVETYYRASFGGVRVPTEELHGLEYELARLEREGEPPC